MALPHQITVERLRELFNQLREDDVLVPNQVRNLAIFRGGTQIGYISLLDGHQHINLYDNDEKG